MEARRLDTDLALVLGLFAAGFSVPSLASSISDRQSPRTAMILMFIAGALILYALTMGTKEYSFAGMPDVFFGVVARFMP
jgi:lipopolysaccharide export LptBFGC system permease protein LptF